jgi:hypothetical protein
MRWGDFEGRVPFLGSRKTRRRGGKERQGAAGESSVVASIALPITLLNVSCMGDSWKKMHAVEVTPGIHPRPPLNLESFMPKMDLRKERL